MGQNNIKPFTNTSGETTYTNNVADSNNELKFKSSTSSEAVYLYSKDLNLALKSASVPAVGLLDFVAEYYDDADFNISNITKGDVYDGLNTIYSNITTRLTNVENTNTSQNSRLTTVENKVTRLQDNITYGYQDGLKILAAETGGDEDYYWIIGQRGDIDGNKLVYAIGEEPVYTYTFPNRSGNILLDSDKANRYLTRVLINTNKSEVISENVVVYRDRIILSLLTNGRKETMNFYDILNSDIVSFNGKMFKSTDSYHEVYDIDNIVIGEGEFTLTGYYEKQAQLVNEYEETITSNKIQSITVISSDKLIV